MPTPLWKPGQSGNLDGRPKGSRSFSTIWSEAIEEIAKEDGISKSEAEKRLIKIRYREMQKGNFNFHKDTDDRIYGKPADKVDLDIKIEKLEEVRQATRMLLDDE